MAREPLSWMRETEGWQGLEQPAQSDEERAAQTRALLQEFETAKLFHAVFAMGQGPALLQHLEDMLFLKPIYATDAIAFNDLQIPLTPDQWCWVRVGQNSVLHHIRAMLVKAVEGPPGLERDDDGNKGTDQSGG